MSASVFARAPGRVNLIGEHTDYNDGFVMPVAIALGTTVRATARDDRRIAIRSEAFPESAVFDLDRMPTERRGDWTDYARGVIEELLRAGIPLRGAGLAVSSTLPRGAGLSSSASFEVAVASALLEVSGAAMDRFALAQLCQRAEHTGPGVRAGIMDQFASLFGEEGYAIVLDTRSLQYERERLPLGTTIAIANTMLERGLDGGQYNLRRQECEEAVRILRERDGTIGSLRDATVDVIEARREDLGSELYKRAMHVVTENRRVCEAANALKEADATTFGALMYESHESLRDDYEVSCRELDLLVEAARNCQGVYGSRMTGAGFGGCTVSLLESNALDRFRETVARRYRSETDVRPQFYDGTPSEGALVRAQGA